MRVSKGWHLLVATFLILKNYFTFSKTRRMLMFRFRFICTFLRVFIPPAIMLLGNVTESVYTSGDVHIL